MLNATKKTFAPIHERPMAMGTRCHQLGMYVVFESPLQMLADSPSNYLREPEAMEFLAPVPTVWTRPKFSMPSWASMFWWREETAAIGTLAP